MAVVVNDIFLPSDIPYGKNHATISLFRSRRFAIGVSINGLAHRLQIGASGTIDDYATSGVKDLRHARAQVRKLAPIR